MNRQRFLRKGLWMTKCPVLCRKQTYMPLIAIRLNASEYFHSMSFGSTPKLRSNLFNQYLSRQMPFFNIVSFSVHCVFGFCVKILLPGWCWKWRFYCVFFPLSGGLSCWTIHKISANKVFIDRFYTPQYNFCRYLLCFSLEHVNGQKRLKMQLLLTFLQVFP